MRLPLIILTAAITLVGSAAEKKEVLRLDVYPMGGMSPMLVHSILTNVSNAPITVPTRSYSDGVDGWSQGGDTGDRWILIPG
jgi:hypothetical protein